MNKPAAAEKQECVVSAEALGVADEGAVEDELFLATIHFLTTHFEMKSPRWAIVEDQRCRSAGDAFVKEKTLGRTELGKEHVEGGVVNIEDEGLIMPRVETTLGQEEPEETLVYRVGAGIEIQVTRTDLHRRMLTKGPISSASRLGQFKAEAVTGSFGIDEVEKTGAILRVSPDRSDASRGGVVSCLDTILPRTSSSATALRTLAQPALWMFGEELPLGEVRSSGFLIIEGELFLVVGSAPVISRFLGDIV